MENVIKKYQSEIVASMICLILGMLSGSMIKTSDYLWYGHLAKPSFTPPNWLFGPAWTTIYIMMGIALGKIWNQRQEYKGLLAIFIVQFIFNLLWTPLFFYFHRIDLALYDICLLWLSLIIFMVMSQKIRTVLMLFVPYIVWVSFALTLNLGIYLMNIALKAI